MSVWAVEFNSNVPVIIAESTQNLPDITVGDDGMIYVIWVDTRYGSNVYFAKSYDHGVTFTEGVQVNDATGHVVALISNHPKIEEYEGDLYVFWADQRDGYYNTNIYMAKSTDGGEVWSPGVAVGSGFKFNLYPEVNVDDSGTIHLVYYEYSSSTLEFERIRYRKSVNGGESFSFQTIVSNYSGSIPCECCPADIAILPDGQKIAVFRDNDENIRDIFGTRSPAGSNNWGDLFQISDEDFFISYCPSSGPSLAVLESTVAIGYMVGVDDVPRTFLKISSDSGETYGDSIIVDPSAAADVIQDHPSVAMTSDSLVHIAWEDRRDGADIYYGNMMSEDVILGDIQVINDDDTGEAQGEVRMVSGSDGFIYVVWSDRRNGDYDIYFVTNYGLSEVDGKATFIPSNIVLNQNYPNPFNPTTTIPFKLVKREKVTLTIYNILGREVVTLIKGEAMDSGHYGVIWDGSDYSRNFVSPGVYYYRLTNGSDDLIRKMVLIE